MTVDEPIDISVVVPVHKEEANIRPFLVRMESVLAKVSARYEIVFCLEPSPDRTEERSPAAADRGRTVRMACGSS